MDNDYCIYFMRGEFPIMDLKYDVMRHPNIKEIGIGGAEPYQHGVRRKELQEEKQAVEEVQNQKIRVQKTATDLNAFLLLHAVSNDVIAFNIDELEISEEALQELAVTSPIQ